jgi:hypothetical protein
MVPSYFALLNKNYYAGPEFSIILSGLNYYECFVNKITTGHAVRYRYLVTASIVIVGGCFHQDKSRFRCGHWAQMGKYVATQEVYIQNNE